MFDAGLIVAVVLLGVVAWLRADPDRKQRAAAWLACGWVLPSAAFLGYMTTQLGLWAPFTPLFLRRGATVSWALESTPAAFFPVSHIMIFAAPLVVLIWRIVIWGWVPSVLFPRLDLRLVYAFGVVVDQWLLRFTFPGGRSSLPAAALYHALVATACLFPAQWFSRWTRERSHLSGRVWLHFIFHSMLLLGVLSILILSLAGSFEAPFLRDSIANKLFLQLILIPGVLLASAMREFYLAGGTPMPADAPLKLVTTGPYAYVANPMQIGKFGVLAGWAFFWSSPAILAIAVLGALYSLTVASPREDIEMQARFGSEWPRYRSEVRRWWPRWRPYLASTSSSGAPEPSRLYLAGDCGPCTELARWLTRQKPTGLLVLPLASNPGSKFQNVTYSPADGGADEHGIRALSRAAGHINLIMAFFGWMISLPVISWLAGLIADVVVAKSPAQPCMVRPAIGTAADSVMLPAASPVVLPATNLAVQRTEDPDALPAAIPTIGSAPGAYNPILHWDGTKRSNSPSKLPLVVWIIPGQSIVLGFLVLFFLVWKGSTPELVWRLNHGSTPIRFEAARELARRGSAAISAAPALEEALNDTNLFVQTSAAEALLRMGAWDRLNSTNWITHTDSYTITAAETKVANTFPPPLAALPVLEQVLRHHPDASVREQTALTLGQYGDRAIPALQDAEGDSDPNVRSWAHNALNRIRLSERSKR